MHMAVTDWYRSSILWIWQIGYYFFTIAFFSLTAIIIAEFTIKITDMLCILTHDKSHQEYGSSKMSTHCSLVCAAQKNAAIYGHTV